MQEQERIDIFNKIRNIPYAHIPELRNPKTGPSGLLEKGEGSCTPKHFLLGSLFEQAGYKVKYVTYPFHWTELSDIGIRYPSEIKKLADKMKQPGLHLACKIFIDGEWVFVDVTWDPSMKKVGFPVNKWDGFSDTENAVKPLQEVTHRDTEDKFRFNKEFEKKYSREEIRNREEFYKALHKWLRDLRSNV